MEAEADLNCIKLKIECYLFMKHTWTETAWYETYLYLHVKLYLNMSQIIFTKRITLNGWWFPYPQFPS